MHPGTPPPQAQDKVKKVTVSLEGKMATVEVDVPSQVDALKLLPGLVTAVKDLGFEAEPHIDYSG